MLNLIFGVSFLFFSIAGFAKDSGFRYINGKCVDSTGNEGLNKSYVGQCGDLSGSTIGGIDLSEMDLSGSKFVGADMQLTIFKKTILKGVDFSGALLSGADFSEAVIEDALFREVIMKNVSLYGSTLNRIDFTKADLSENNFNFGIFKDVNFSEANLSKVQFGDSDLSHGNFEGANCKEAVFTNANLNGATFEESNLRASNFDRTDFSTLMLKNAKFNRKTKLPITQEQAIARGMVFIEFKCKPESGIEFGDTCYYLDGSGGHCIDGFTLAPQSILAIIAPSFKGKIYQNQTSSNCCIWHKDIDVEGEDYGMGSGDCNTEEVFVGSPLLDGTRCTNENQREDKQLTLCMSE